MRNNPTSRAMNEGLTIATLVAALAGTPALAHHSRANFDLDSLVEVEGTVTEFAWTNPHVFVVVEGRKAGSADVHEWTFELNSTPVQIRSGWTANTLKAGDRVVARGNPDRDANRRFIYGSVFLRGSEEIVVRRIPAGTVPPPTTAEQQAAKSTDFTGVWNTRSRAEQILGSTADTQLVNALPVNEKGQQQLDRFNPDDNPAWRCEPPSLPNLLTTPYPFEITRPSPDILKIVYEVHKVERTIHLGSSGPTANTPRTPRGHSIGRFENGELVIETSNFAAVRWGNGRAVDGSERKSTVERYSLGGDGKTLTLKFSMTDPEYLREAVTDERTYDLSPGYELQDYVCDPATARRHLEAGRD